MELRFHLMWIGALFFVAGVIYLAAQPIWRGRLSSPKPSNAPVGGTTLEPPKPGAGFGLKSNWPGLAAILLGCVLLVAGAIV